MTRCARGFSLRRPFGSLWRVKGFGLVVAFWCGKGGRLKSCHDVVWALSRRWYDAESAGTARIVRQNYYGECNMCERLIYWMTLELASKGRTALSRPLRLKDFTAHSLGGTWNDRDDKGAGTRTLHQSTAGTQVCSWIMEYIFFSVRRFSCFSLWSLWFCALDSYHYKEIPRARALQRWSNSLL